MRFRKKVIPIVLLMLLAAFGIWAGSAVTPRQLQEVIHRCGSWAAIAYVGLFAVLPAFFFPVAVLALAGGLLFGLCWLPISGRRTCPRRRGVSSGMIPVPPGISRSNRKQPGTCWESATATVRSRSTPDAGPIAAAIFICWRQRTRKKARSCATDGWKNSSGTGPSSAAARAVWVLSAVNAGKPSTCWSCSSAEANPGAGQTVSKPP